MNWNRLSHKLRLRPSAGWAVRLAAALSFGCISTVAQPSNGLQDAPDRLFVREDSGFGAGRPSLARSRSARLNLPTLARLATEDPSGVIRLSVDLSDDETYELTIDNRERLEPGRVLCRGRVVGHPGSDVTLAISGHAVAGTVFIPGRGTFQLQYAGKGMQRIVQADDHRLPQCGQTSHAAGDGAVTATGDFLIQAASGPNTATNTIIDLMIVYTGAARAGAGGTDGMNALIDAAVAEANLAFANSEVRAQLQLVYRGEVNYNETGDINDDLDRLEDDDEHSLLASVHQLRATYRADLVCMITETTGGPYGLANQMREVETEFGQKAFSIVQRQYAISYQALAHELGHNMGCQHDRITSPTGGAYDYSHAYRFETNGVLYHTVMAYQPGLPIPYFSNPDVLFLGVPTGVAEPSTNSANNAKTLSRTVSTVARFDSVIRFGQPPQVTLLSPTNGAMFTVPTVIEVTADATDVDGQVVEVAFYVNGVRAKSMTAPPFTMQWTNSTPGTYFFRAEAKDNSGWDVYSSRAQVTLTYAPPTIDVAGTYRLADGTFQVRMRGVDGQAFRLEATEDFVLWKFLTTDSFFGETMDYLDNRATNYLNRFYRVLPVP